MDIILTIENNYKIMRDNIIIIMDNAKIHLTPYVLKSINENGGQLLFNSAYSP